MTARVVLICHADDPMNREALAAWLASVTSLAGVVVLHEPPGRLWRRIRREVRRVGLPRFLDVLAFRLYYAAFLRRNDQLWEQETLRRLLAEYGPVPASTPVMHAESPNAPAVADFIRGCAPDLMIARCKSLLSERVFTLPRVGTFVMHPGICPEYRNAHGCFWALARGDDARVGMTLLRIDKGVDTGPVYGYYHCAPGPLGPSHVVIQHRVVFDNLPAIADRLHELASGQATSIDTSGRESGTWGQPWLSAYLRWRRRVRQAAR